MPITLTATRYVAPLREGGSLPAIVEANDEALYVLKFRGAGQGRKALVAEWIGGEVARTLGLPVPPVALVDLDPVLGRSEPDEEIQDLLFASAGLNFGMAYLPSALTFDVGADPPPTAWLASAIVWFDALITNVDRTPSNPNLLFWDGQLWMIDHGAALYFHHAWPDVAGRDRSPFAPIRDHVLLPFASRLDEVDATFSELLTPDAMNTVLRGIPDEWLDGEPGFTSADAVRDAYRAFLLGRLMPPRPFLEEAKRGHAHYV